MLKPTDPLNYYAQPGLMTDPGEGVDLLAGLPGDILALCRVVQGALLHVFWAERYGQKLSPERQQEVGLRSVGEMLTHLRARDERPLTEPRPLEERLVGNCRDFAVLLCALLRHQGRPARARCGFATYFEPDKYVDHWICEYWPADERHWIQVDPQLDDLQREALEIQFDPHDVPHDRFLPAGKAWQLCRAGQADPNTFGIFDMWGLWFVRGNLVRDLAALNKIELLPWDGWGLIDGRDEDLIPDDWALLDQVADLTLADNAAFDSMRALYQGDERLRVPSVINSYTEAGVQRVDLTWYERKTA